MPIENLEDEGLPKNPNLELAQWKFLLSTDKYRNDEGLRKKLTDVVKGDNMAPFYEEVCHSLNWKADEHLLSKMKEANSAELKKLDEAIEDAEKNLGETEVREFMLKKAEYLSTIGDKEGALSQFRKTFEKTVTLGYRLDLVFHLIRIGLFYMDHDLVTRYLEKAQALIDEGGDWDRRNRLKVYRGVYCMSIRDFKNAANLFLDTVATFTSYELMDYYTFVTYTVFCCMIALERPQLREKLVAWVSCHSEVPGLVCSIGNAFYRTTEEYAAAAAQGQEDSIEMMFVCKNKVIKGSEILEVLHSLSTVREFLFSLYDCHYGEFFKCLAQVEDIMKYDRLLAPHYRYFVREMRIVAYSQLLESYRSLTLNYMADAFQVTMEFIDQELSRFIAAGRLHCRIDKVGGIVETNRPDSKNWQYQATIKQGDILLNRIQKLSRVINI